MVHQLIMLMVRRNHFVIQLNWLHFVISIWLHCSFHLHQSFEHLNLNHLVVNAHKISSTCAAICKKFCVLDKKRD